jgi:GNAT superfamily N-acetyltransferase
VRIVHLAREALPEASELLVRALPFDHVAPVADEKLFGDNGARNGQVLAAVEGDALVGLLAQAGRWVKVLAVAEPWRRRGVATRLLDAARESAGGRSLRIFDHPGNYLSPGLDERYPDGEAFLRARGFQVVGEVENLRVRDFDDPRLGDARATELARRAVAQGYTLHRAAPDDAQLLEFVARTFAAMWANEVKRALSGPRRAVHVALLAGQPVAFAAGDGNNQGLGWFGPAGTAPEHRGRGLGEALLLRVLADVRGLPEAGVIAWIGPKEFYERTCGAISDRRFRQYEQK